MTDKWKPKELPRNRSLRKFQDIPEPTGSFNSKTSEPNLPVCQKRTEEKLITDRNSDADLQMFLKACGAATSAVEKNIQGWSQFLMFLWICTSWLTREHAEKSLSYWDLGRCFGGYFLPSLCYVCFINRCKLMTILLFSPVNSQKL